MAESNCRKMMMLEFLLVVLLYPQIGLSSSVTWEKPVNVQVCILSKTLVIDWCVTCVPCPPPKVYENLKNACPQGGASEDCQYLCNMYKGNSDAIGIGQMAQVLSVRATCHINSVEYVNQTIEVTSEIATTTKSQSTFSVNATSQLPQSASSIYGNVMLTVICILIIAIVIILCKLCSKRKKRKALKKRGAVEAEGQKRSCSQNTIIACRTVDTQMPLPERSPEQVQHLKTSPTEECTGIFEMETASKDQISKVKVEAKMATRWSMQPGSSESLQETSRFEPGSFGKSDSRKQSCLRGVETSDGSTYTDQCQHTLPANSNEDRLSAIRCHLRHNVDGKTKEEQLSTVFATKDFCGGFFDHRGGSLQIPESSVQLYIPPGALPDGVLQEIYIYLCHYDGSNGASNNSPASPIIRCGPPGLRFREGIFGAVLSFPSAHNDAPFGVFTKDSGGDLNTGWINLTEKSANRCFKDADGNVHLMLNHFSDFKTEKEPQHTDSSAEGFKLRAFGKPYKPRQFIFHFFVCMFKPSEQKKLDEEAECLGFYPLQDGNKLINNIDEGKCVTVKLEDLKNGWQPLYADEREQTLQASADHCITSKCDFILSDSSSSAAAQYTGGLHCRIIATSGTQEVKLPIQVQEGWKYKCDEDESAKSDVACSRTNQDVRASPHLQLGLMLYGKIIPKIENHISKPAYYNICMELSRKQDPPTDWRLLMSDLGLPDVKYIHAVEDGSEAGAVVVINLFFAMNKGMEALQKLHRACKHAKLYRACAILEKDQPLLCPKPPIPQILPDVTQQASADTLSHMMNQSMLAENGLIKHAPTHPQPTHDPSTSPFVDDTSSFVNNKKETIV